MLVVLAIGQHKFETEAHNGRLHFLDWLNFEEEFWKNFLPLNSEAAAVNALEMTDYFQGHQEKGL